MYSTNLVNQMTIESILYWGVEKKIASDSIVIYNLAVKGEGRISENTYDSNNQKK